MGGLTSDNVLLGSCKVVLGSGRAKLCDELNKVRKDASGIVEEIEDLLNLTIANTVIRRTKDAYKSSPLREIDLVDMMESFVETYNTLEKNRPRKLKSPFSPSVYEFH